VDQGSGNRWRISGVAMVLLMLTSAGLAQVPTASEVEAVTDSLATLDLTVPPDSLATAIPDTVPAALQMPETRDFFDTGINGTTSVLMTPVFPGWGQLYADGSWQAAVAFGAQWYFWSNMLRADRNGVRNREYAETLPAGSTRDFYDDRANESYEIMRDYAWWSGGILLLVALDAYVEAGLFNFDEDPVPVPRRFDEYFDTTIPEPPGSRGAPNLVIFQWGQQF